MFAIIALDPQARAIRTRFKFTERGAWEEQAKLFKEERGMAACVIVQTKGEGQGTTFSTPRGDNWGPEYAVPLNA